MAALSRISDSLWNPWLLGLFLFTGLVYSLGSGFFQFFDFPLWFKTTVGSFFQSRRRAKGGLSSLQALATALASTMGTGSIAGVATALTLGGPGAVFWMWVSALLGMMTGCGEKLLAVRYQQHAPDGTLQGGPMFYLHHGLHAPLLATWFSLACLPATLAGGNLVQSSSIATALEAAFGTNRMLTGLITALLATLGMVGGIGRIASVSAALVPAMAALYLGSGVTVLVCRAEAIPGAIHAIVLGALSPSAALGGGAGWTVAVALRYGVARGVFTNEAGLGTAAMAHGAAQVDHPARQGMWGIFEVCLSTLVVCTITALVILTSTAWNASPAQALTGAPLTAAAFAAAFAASRINPHVINDIDRTRIRALSTSSTLATAFPLTWHGVRVRVTLFEIRSQAAVARPAAGAANAGATTPAAATAGAAATAADIPVIRLVGVVRITAGLATGRRAALGDDRALAGDVDRRTRRYEQPRPAAGVVRFIHQPIAAMQGQHGAGFQVQHHDAVRRRHHRALARTVGDVEGDIAVDLVNRVRVQREPTLGLSGIEHVRRKRRRRRKRQKQKRKSRKDAVHLQFTVPHLSPLTFRTPLPNEPAAAASPRRRWRRSSRLSGRAP